MIRVNDVSFSYRKNRLYDRFNLQIEAPGVYGVFGRNGSGKSTLLKLLAGLLFPRNGEIEVLGFSPRQRRADFLASVYVVPEEFHLPNLTAARLAQTQSGFYPTFSPAAFADYLSVFELSADQPFDEMSLGQKKKAAMAFALATFTPVLLLDEPTNGLDIVGRDQFKQILSRAEQRNRVIVISTHQAHDLERIMSHILFIDGAALALSATMAELSAGLTMGVASDAAAIERIDGVIHREAVGEQVAYVAANRTRNPGSVHLELLYKALSLNKDGVLAALAASAQGAANV